MLRSGACMEEAGDVTVNRLRELAGLTKARIRDNRKLAEAMDADLRTLKAELAVLERMLEGAEPDTKRV